MPSRPGAREGGAALALLLAATVTGGTLSPLLPLLIAALILLVRAGAGPAVLLAPPVAAAALIATDAVRDVLSAGRLAAGVFVVLAVGPGLLWRRESRRTAGRLARLDEILTEAERGRLDTEAPASADDLADLERALATLAARLGVLGITVWEVDGNAGHAKPRVSIPRPAARRVELAGDPLGWVWDQGIRMRIDPPPRWAPAGYIAVAERLRRTETDRGDVVSYLVPRGGEPPDDATLDQAAIYVRGVLGVHEGRAAYAAARRRLRVVLDRLGGISGDLALPSFARGLCETAMEVVDATGAAVGDWHGSDGTVLGATGDDGGPRHGDSFIMPASELALGVAAGDMIVRDGTEWSLGRTCIAHEAERWDRRPRSLAVLPLRGPAGIVGVLSVWSSRSRTLDPEALEMLRLLAPYAALHLQHARAYGTLRETAERDPLTQLRNRRSFDDVFAAETRRWERYARPLAVMLLDIDHFKSVNDTWGHEAGDEVLRRVARVIAANVRDSDIAARLGGEEFVVVMPETEIAAAADVAERIRRAVAEVTVEWRGTAIPVRVSAGVSAAPERATHPRDLIGSADAALYRAKDAGRNRVVLA